MFIWKLDNFLYENYYNVDDITFFLIKCRR